MRLRREGNRVAGENCIMRSWMICTAHNILLKVKLFCYMPCRLLGDVEVSCILTQPQCYVGVGVQIPFLADLPLGKGHCTNYTGGWVGLGAGLHGSRNSNPAAKFEPQTA
jgi:hypothetical protein